MEAARTAPRPYAGKSAEQRRAERRAALVEAAVAIWQEHGWAAVTMRGVCARAGLTDRYFYESFADRDALLATLWDQKRDETLATLFATVTSAADRPPLEQLRAVEEVVVHQILDDPASAQILFGDHAGSAVLEQRRRDLVRLTTDLIIDFAQPHLAAGIDEQALRVRTLIGMGGFVELMLAWRSGLIDADADAIVGHLSGIAAALATEFLRADVPSRPPERY